MNACSAWCGWCGACDNDPRVEVLCTDCRQTVDADDAAGGICDACADRRDAHSSALEIRMAQADLPAVKKDVA